MRLSFFKTSNFQFLSYDYFLLCSLKDMILFISNLFYFFKRIVSLVLWCCAIWFNIKIWSDSGAKLHLLFTGLQNFIEQSWDHLLLLSRLFRPWMRLTCWELGILLSNPLRLISNPSLIAKLIWNGCKSLLWFSIFKLLLILA